MVISTTLKTSMLCGQTLQVLLWTSEVSVFPGIRFLPSKTCSLSLLMVKQFALIVKEVTASYLKFAVRTQTCGTMISRSNLKRTRQITLGFLWPLSPWLWMTSVQSTSRRWLSSGLIRDRLFLGVCSSNNSLLNTKCMALMASLSDCL